MTRAPDDWGLFSPDSPQDDLAPTSPASYGPQAASGPPAPAYRPGAYHSGADYEAPYAADLAPAPRPPGAGDTWAARFAEYDQRHPEVWAAIVRFADEAAAAGATRVGMRAIIERVRWEHLVRPDAAEQFSINNNYAGFYARKLADLAPRYAAMLELRGGRHVGDP